MKNKKLKTIFYILLASLGLLTAAVTLAWGWLSWRIHAVVDQELGAEIKQMHLSWDEGALVISDLILVQKTPGETYDLQAKIDQIRVKWAGNILEQNFAFDLFVHSPYVKLNRFITSAPPPKQLEKLTKILKTPVKKGGFEIIFQAYVDNAVIEVVSGQSRTVSSPFRLIVKHGASHSQFLDRMRTPIVIDFQREALTVQLEQFSGKLFWDVLEGFLGPDFAQWQCLQGTVNGGVTLSKNPRNKELHVVGEISLENLEMMHKVSGLGGEFQKISIKTHSGMIFSKSTQDFSGTAELLISQPATLYRYVDGDLQWALSDVKGFLDFGGDHKPQSCEWLFQGHLNLQPESLFLFQGSFPALFNQQLEGMLQITRQSPGTEEMHTELKIGMGRLLQKDLQLSIVNWGPQELDLVSKLWPKMNLLNNEFQLQEGNFSGKIIAAFNESKSFPIESLSIREVKGSNLHFALQTPKLNGVIPDLSGWLDLKVEEKDFPSLYLENGELSFSEAEVRIQGDPDLKETEHLTHFSGSLAFKERVLKQGTVSGQLAGLQGRFNYLGASSPLVANLHVEGQVSSLAELLPYQWSDQMKKSFGDDHFSWSGHLSLAGQGLRAEGALLMASQGQDEEHHLDLTVDFERLYQEEEEELQPSWRKWGIALFPLASAEHLLIIDWMQDNKGSWGLKLKQGSFQSSKFPLKRYLSPFLFPVEEATSLSGVGKIHGTFDFQTFMIHLQAYHACLDDPAYQIYADEIGDPFSKDGFISPTAFFYFDLQQKKRFGFIPIAQGSFLDKKHKLHFKDTKASIYLDDEQIDLQQVSTQAEGICFEADMQIDLSVPDSLRIDIQTQKIISTLSAAQKFSAHFSESPFWKLPMQGHFLSGVDGGNMSILIPKDPAQDNQVEWTLQGDVSAASIPIASSQLLLHNLGTRLHYQSSSSTLLLTQIKGELMNVESEAKLGKVVGDQLSFDHSAEGKMNFDVALKDQLSNEMMRLAGIGKLMDEGKIDLHFTPLISHFKGIRPAFETLKISDGKLSFLKAGCCVDLCELIAAAPLLKQFGWLPLSEEELSSIKEYALQGALRNELEWDDVSKCLNLKISSPDICWSQGSLGPLKLEAKLSQENMSDLQMLHLGPLQMRGHLQWSSDGVDLKKVYINYGAGLQLAVSGHYDFLKKKFLFQCHEYLVDLESLQSLPKWHALLEPWKLFGKVFGSGKGQLSKASAKENWQFIGEAQAQLQDLEVRKIRIQNDGIIELNFSSIDGLKVEGLDLHVKRHDRKAYSAKLALKSAHYEAEGEQLRLDGLDFSLPGSSLIELVEIMRELFPDLIDENTTAFLKEIRCEGGLHGLLKMELSPNQVVLRLNLQDGRYTLWNHHHDLKKVVLELGPKQIRFQSQYNHLNRPYQLFLEVDRSSLKAGRLLLKDGNEPPLVLYWELDAAHKLLVNRVEGAIAGLEIHLAKSANSPAASQTLLLGHVKLFDVKKLMQVLPPEYAALITRAEIGNGYELKGQFFLSKEDWTELSFQGTLLGNHFRLFGYDLDQLWANLSFNSKQILFHNLHIFDPAGRVLVPEGRFYKDVKGEWKFHLPAIQFQEVKPSKLSEANKPATTYKHLVIKKAELKEVCGYLSNPASYVGTGSFSFENMAKKNFLEETLLAIPNELIGRIGLNPNVLIPAMGTVQFSMKDGRFYLSKLVDVYSEGKRSRFYLSKNGFPSYSDFDGNLNLYVRMKQYNLLFKLAELCEVHVKGSLEKPNYSLTKQKINKK